MLACECAAWYAARGMTLLDGLNALYGEFGWYKNALLSQSFPGQNGMSAMAGLMASLRSDAPKEIGNRKVTGTTDYLSEGTGLPPAGVLEFRLEGDAKLIVRPSGTEPKLKLYLSVKENAEEDALAALDGLTAAANALIRGRSGFSLKG